MGAYIIRRFLLLIPTLLVATMIVFMIVRLIPGDVVSLMVAQHGESGGMMGVTEVTVKDIEHRLGLDVPLYVQYGRWLSNVIRGDLGRSLWTDVPVVHEIRDRVVISFELGSLTIIIGLIFALPIGVYSAIRQDTISDYVARSFSILCIAVPGFWLATLLMTYPSIWWRWSPSIEYIAFAANPIGNLTQFIIPATIAGLNVSGLTMRMTRTTMLEVLRQDYVRTAWSKGLRERVVVIRHALKNALIPVVTLVGMQLPMVVGGQVVMEQIFQLPGVGLYLITAINQRDYVALSGINIFVASVVLAANLCTDLTYGLLDPRVHYG